MFVRYVKYGVTLTLLTLLLSGCFNLFGGGSAPSVTHEVTGTVTEAVLGLDGEPMNAPLRGVTVKLGSQSVKTNPRGVFKFTRVPEGNHTLTAEIDGYGNYSRSVSVRRNVHVDVELQPTGGGLDVAGTPFAALDGRQFDSSIVIEGNVEDFTPAALRQLAVTTLGANVQPLDTALTVTQLQALINGVVEEIAIAPDGSFRAELPIDPGSNTIQLRVFDDRGHAYTSPAVVVTSTLERLDLRIVMRWDTDDTDVDLHLFKRGPGEPNPAGVEPSSPFWTRDRHVYYSNKVGDDFGDHSDQHAFLDIDDTSGFGPETIVLQEATPGYYHVWVHFYAIRNADASNVTVDIILNEPGRDEPLFETFTKELTENKEYWYVATVAYPAGEIIQVAPVQAVSTAGFTETLGAIAPAK